jgi:glutamine cyclotransferase
MLGRPPMRRALSSIVLLFGIASVAACNGCAHVAEPEPQPSQPPAATAPAPKPPRSPAVPAVVGKRPHDPRAFTQGLVFADGVFFESTGRYGESSLRRVDPETGRVLTSVSLPPDIFAEGLALLHGELYQLSWREGRCFVYDAKTLEKRRELRYEGEGWGLATDGAQLVMSDGSSTLRFRDPASFRVVREIEVRDGGRPVTQLNELEWVKGEILANVWMGTVVLRIDPASGKVLGVMALADLPEPRHDDPDAVLNGIAYDAAGDRLFVTGKLWSTVFEIR